MSLEHKMPVFTKIQQSTPNRVLLPSPIDKTPPLSTKKRALNELSINLPIRPQSAQEFTTPEHPSALKRYRKVSEPYATANALMHPSSSIKRDSPAEDSVWGPDVEKAFHDAIRKIPKLGRRKVCIGSKPCGRNELIASYILTATGKHRSRKQVSSHIQVLKHIRRDDPEFLALVADAKDGEFEDISPKFDLKDFDTLSSADRSAFGGQEFHSNTLIDDDHSPLGKAQRFKSQMQLATRSYLTIEDFSMWATKANDDYVDLQSSNVYTRFDKTHTHPSIASLDTIPDWAAKFPCLPSLIARIDPTDCPIYHLQASLSLPDSLDVTGKEAFVLRVRLAMAGLLPTNREEWTSNTRVYTRGKEVLDVPQKVMLQESLNGSTTQNTCVEVPFATDFWACFLGSLANIDQSRQSHYDAEAYQHERERNSRDAVANITVVQDITTKATTSKASKTLCVLVWNFGKAHRNEIGLTKVTQLTLPESPVASRLQPPTMTRAISQPQSLPRQFSARPKLGSVALKRSQSMAAVPQHPIYPAQPPVSYPSAGHNLGPMQYPLPPQPMLNSVPLPQDSSLYYLPVDETASTVHRPMYHSEIPSGYMGEQQVNATSYAMARSYSAPSWQQGTAPTQYAPSFDMGTWADGGLDWGLSDSLPESAGYMQSEFHSADDFFGATPSRAHSTMPQAFNMEHVTSSGGSLEDNEDPRMPQMGYFSHSR